MQKISVGEVIPDFKHLGHTIAFTVENYDTDNIPEGYDVKNDLFMQTDNPDLLVRALAAKMVENETFMQVMLHAIYVFHKYSREKPNGG